jgi:hypothetical protein
MPNRIEARSAKAALTNATGRLPLLRLFSTPLTDTGLVPRSRLSGPPKGAFTAACFWTAVRRFRKDCETLLGRALQTLFRLSELGAAVHSRIFRLLSLDV